MIQEIEEIIGLDCSNILKVSAKQGIGIEETLEAIVERVPPPKNRMAEVGVGQVCGGGAAKCGHG